MRKINKQKLILIGAACGLAGFGFGYLIRQTSEAFAIEPNKIRVALTHPGSFRQLGFVDCQSKIIKEINAMEEVIYVQAYSFTSVDIASALVRAAKRGVKVRVLLDKENESKPSEAMRMLIDNGIEVKIRHISGISHNKIIVSNKVLITGSYNFTKAANERNDENIVIIHNPEVARKFIKHWFICYNSSVNLGEVSVKNAKPWERKNYTSVSKINSTEWRNRNKLTEDYREFRNQMKKNRNSKLVNAKLYEPQNELWMMIQFVKDDSLLQTINRALTNGVEVRILCDPKLVESSKDFVDQIKDTKAQVKFGNCKENIIICDDNYVSVVKKKNNNSFTSSVSVGSKNLVEQAKKTFMSAWEGAENAV